ncbi:S9 family peptidase [Streptomyces fulvoviolaceus]|uniref:S9 family peptidase n=1 Tax=Streptomyces fulvoviolaceus TaxID=285535 RepID=UPI000694283A|nr:prolyl oligopeptidase family serine peptidase [Streptomyces fulvoviolaceus]
MAPTSLPEQLVRTRRFTRGVPERFAVSPDGRTVLFLRGRTGDDPAACVWALDLGTGAERLLADPVRLLAGRQSHLRGRQTRTVGIESYATDRNVGLVAFALAGGLWKLEVGKGEPRRLPAIGPVSDPRPDPTGRRIAYVSHGALRVTETDGTGDRAVAEPDGPYVEFGAAVHTAATSLDGSRGHWWSPDGTRLLVARTDSTAVRPWPATDSAGLGDAPHTPPRFAAAGTPNADVTLWIAGLDGPSGQVSWDRTAFEYLVGAGWDAQGPWAVVQSRDQRTVRFLGIAPDDGRTAVLDEQHDACWVQLVPGLPARTGSGAVLAHRDLRGTRHLTVDGVPVTPAGLQLRAVLGIDADEVLFTASDDPTETHLWSYGAAVGLRRLSSGPGIHSGASRGGTLVRVTRGADRPGGRAEVLRAGGPAVPVLSHAEHPVLDNHARRLVLGPRGLHARLHLPSWHRPGSGPLPVLLDPYGGASAQRVTAELDWRVLLSQWFAEHGFAVLVADGRGTPGRGPDWEREVHGDLFAPVLDDQVTALHEAARLVPDLDLGRVAIRGWSFSGALAALAVLRRPDVFHAAVAGAGVTDQRLYNAHWRERFLGHPDVFPHRYDACNVLLDAPRLARPLLLIHGLADPNVPSANTLRLSDALRVAGRPHELLLLPGGGHQPIGSTVTEKLLSHQVRFLQRHLSPVPHLEEHSVRPKA